jgi:hypothetical protein
MPAFNEAVTFNASKYSVVPACCRLTVRLCDPESGVPAGSRLLSDNVTVSSCRISLSVVLNERIIFVHGLREAPAAFVAEAVSPNDHRDYAF